MRIRLVLGALALLGGCTPPPAPPPSAPADAPAGGGTPGAQADSPRRARYGALEAWLEAPGTVRAGEPAALVLHVRNVGTRPDTLMIGGIAARPAFDFFVTRPDGSLVWQRLNRRTVELTAHPRPLSPGEEITFRDTWPLRDNAGDPVGPGSYSARGVLRMYRREDLQTPAVPIVIAR